MVQIDCPSCQTAFEVEDKLLRRSLDKQGQRHLRCSACKHVFVYAPIIEPEPISEPDLSSDLQDEINLADLPILTAERDAKADAQMNISAEFPSFISAKTPLMAPKRDDSWPQNRPVTSDFGPSEAQKTESYPQKSARKQSGLTGFLAFLILITLIILVGIWISMTHPEWFRASYWLETNI